MTDEPHVPMSDQPDPAAEPTPPNAVAPETQPLPQQPSAAPPSPPAPPSWSAQSTPPSSPPAAPASWSAPTAWGSAPQGWPPPPPVTPPTPEAAASVQPPGSVPPPVGPPTGPGTWGYGYGAPGWGAPQPPSTPSRLARVILVVVAIVALALASGGVGAAISSAVHSDDTATEQQSPNNGNGNNGLGLVDPTFPFDFGNGSGNGNGNGSGSGAVPQHITDKVNPAVVDVFTTIDTGSSTGEAAGTGMILTSDGEILTNNHVIDGATEIRVEIPDTGETYKARVLGYNIVDDVALIKIDGASDLETIDTESDVQIGDPVFAIGNAGGQGGTPVATSGSVTALDQRVTAGDSSGDTETLHGMIQISAPIEPGDSGGPLVDSDGKVIGMNTAAAQNDSFLGGGGSTTAFAIPIDKAIGIVQQIRDGHDSDTVHVGERGILGVQVRNPGSLGDTAPVTPGAAVIGVKDGTPADDAGIGAGDVITGIDGKTVRSASDLTAAMFKYHPDDDVKVTWVDENGDSNTATVTLIPGPPA
jgi:S1-C subfamily serine protease